MCSQGSQSQTLTDQVSLPLTKFSHATVSGDTTRIPWTHLSGGDNMFAVFETIRTQHSNGQIEVTKYFRVIRNHQPMEDINLEILAEEAQKAVNKSKVLKLASRLEAVTIIVQSPCIAVRYPLPTHQIRRFQMRFAKDADYYEALRRLAEVKAPFTEAGTLQQLQPRPSSSASSLMRASDSASCVNAPSISASSGDGSDAAGITKGSTNGWPSHQPGGPVMNSVYGMRTAISSGISLSAAENQPCKLHVEPETYLSQNDHSSSHYFPSPIANEIQSIAASRYANKLQATEPVMQVATKSPFFTQASDSSISNVFTAPSSSLPPANRSQKFINLYEPRPSTAPAIENQNLSQMLPPRRELPFIKPVSRRGWNVIEAGKNSAVATTTANAAAVASAQSTSVVNRGLVENSSAPRNVGCEFKLAPTLTTTSASKPAPIKQIPARARSSRKPAATRSRKKTAATTEEVRVPSVEELLSQSQDSAKDVTTPLCPLDTQALISKVEKQQEAAYASSRSVKHTLLTQAENPCSIFCGNTLPKGHQTPQLNKNVEPMPEHMDLDWMDVPQVTEPATLRDSDSQEKPAKHKADMNAVPTADIATGPRSTSVPDHPLSSLTDEVSKPLSVLNSLFQDPNFATSPIAPSWEALPQKQRHVALETWVCTQLQDEGFCRLVVEMESAWRRVLFGG